MTDNPTVIVYAKRTAIGKMNGCFKDTPAPRLAAALVENAKDKLKLAKDEVDEIILGNVLQAGIGQAPSRQAAIYGGLDHSVCATTINRVCGSGLKAVMLADQSIRLGESSLVLAGGMENMTLAPHLLPKARAGYRFGSVEVKDHMQFDGLWDPYGEMPMGHCGDICAAEYQFSRQEQDDFARTSYERSLSASESGKFKHEIVPVEVRTRKTVNQILEDEEPQSVDLSRLGTLRAAFAKDGTITAGNASSINDGAALLALMDLATAKAKGLKPLAKIVAHASHAQEPKWFTTAPISCIRKLVGKAKIDLNDVDLFEINEAFSVVTMAAMKELKLPHSKVNIYGGAVSLGHPIGASGARILVTLLNAMQNENKQRGIAAICLGGGEASAVLVERF